MRMVLHIKASSVAASNPRIRQTSLPLHHHQSLLAIARAASHCSQSNDAPSLLSGPSAVRVAGLLRTIPTGTLSFVGRDANVDSPRSTRFRGGSMDFGQRFVSGRGRRGFATTSVV